MIADSLVRSSVIVKIAITFGDVGKPAITDEPDAVQAFLLERPEESFDVRIAVGRARRNTDVGDPCAGQHSITPSCARLAAPLLKKNVSASVVWR